VKEKLFNPLSAINKYFYKNKSGRQPFWRQQK